MVQPWHDLSHPLAILLATQVEHQPLLWCNQLTRRVGAALLSLAALVPPAAHEPIAPPAATSTTTAATTATSATSAAVSAAHASSPSAAPLWAPPVPLRRRVAALRATLAPRAPALLRRPRTPSLSADTDADADADADADFAKSDANDAAADANAAADALCAEKGQRTGAPEGEIDGVRWIGAGETARWRWADNGVSADDAVVARAVVARAVVARAVVARRRRWVARRGWGSTCARAAVAPGWWRRCAARAVR